MRGCSAGFARRYPRTLTAACEFGELQFGVERSTAPVLMRTAVVACSRGDVVFFDRDQRVGLDGVRSGVGKSDARRAIGGGLDQVAFVRVCSDSWRPTHWTEFTFFTCTRPSRFTNLACVMARRRHFDPAGHRVADSFSARGVEAGCNKINRGKTIADQITERRISQSLVRYRMPIHLDPLHLLWAVLGDADYWATGYSRLSARHVASILKSNTRFGQAGFGAGLVVKLQIAIRLQSFKSVQNRQRST